MTVEDDAGSSVEVRFSSLEANSGFNTGAMADREYRRLKRFDDDPVLAEGVHGHGD